MPAMSQTVALVIDKPYPSDGRWPVGFACPSCGSPSDAWRGNQYCRRCAMVFPVIDEIPCLLPEKGILAAFYAEGG
jgi:hypothetical protein